MKPGTLEDIRTKRLKVALGIPLWQAAGILSSLWYFLGEYAEDGVLTAQVQVDLPAHLEWSGGFDQLLSGLIGSGWLISDGEGLRAAEWDERAPRHVKDRLRIRERRASKSPMYANGSRTVRGQPPPATGECSRTSGPEDNNVRVQPAQKGEGGEGGVRVSNGRAGTKNPSGSEKAPNTAKAKPSPSYPSPTDIDLPESLDTPEVFEALSDWLSYRRATKKPITVQGMNIQVAKYANRPAAFLAAVKHSIGNGYTGLFEPSEKDQSRGQQETPRGKFVEDARSPEERWGAAARRA